MAKFRHILTIVCLLLFFFLGPIAADEDFPGPIPEDAVPERSQSVPDGVLNNLIEMDTDLFEELVAGAMERKVRHDQIWLIFFDHPTCKGCPFVY